MHTEPRLVVITGGPGTGKTTLLHALAAHYPVQPEAGRAIIDDQHLLDGPALPWRDRERYAELMLAHDLRSHHDARRSATTTFFDRGIPDIIGYLRLSGLPVPAHLTEAARRFTYHRRVLITPDWPEIYRQDHQRLQTAEESARTRAHLAAAYTDLGYELVELPRADVPTRAHLARTTAGLHT
ncbi:AAA family ATPase [Saccharopolyspora sp. HNM0983]|uniref:AAA family ATPase n=1 Tax=Saccharopolyspora montiporae TaxID=2781240 RepID=A0A929BC90_9PSEU|nr:AAA family ATPase [Saccharopolyspora sp. HNM0983]MBE9376186.1 AAA family ATPase [Saccharopolyspora sp. HNM0983]